MMAMLLEAPPSGEATRSDGVGKPAAAAAAAAATAGGATASPSQGEAGLGWMMVRLDGTVEAGSDVAPGVPPPSPPAAVATAAGAAVGDAPATGLIDANRAMQEFQCSITQVCLVWPYLEAIGPCVWSVSGLTLYGAVVEMEN